MRLLFILLMFSNYLWSLPTAESLFKNLSNKDITQPVILGEFEIEESEDSEVFKVSEDIDDRAIRYIKVYFYQTSENVYKFIQVDYLDPDKKAENTLRIYEKNNFNNTFNNENMADNKKLFYSILSSLVINDSTLISKFISSITNVFKRNIYLKNYEIEKLYKSYEEYLIRVKENKALKDSLQNPLEPSSPEEKEKVNNLLAAPFYRDNGDVKLINEGRSLYWDLVYENFYARFDNENKQIKKLDFNKEAKMSMVFADPILFNGQHELPKQWYIKTDDSLYRVTPVNLVHYSPSSSGFRRLINKYREAAVKNSKSDLLNKKQMNIKFLN